MKRPKILPNEKRKKLSELLFAITPQEEKIDIYRKLVDNVNSTISNFENKINELEGQIKNLNNDFIKVIEHIVNVQNNTNFALIERLDELTDKIDSIEKEKEKLEEKIKNIKWWGSWGVNMPPSKTTLEVNLTTTDNQTFTLSPAVSFADMEVYRGGARLFSSNGDFTPVYTNGLVSQITLSSALAVGESLNVIGKI